MVGKATPKHDPNTLILRFGVEWQIFAFYAAMNLDEYFLEVWAGSDNCFVTPDDMIPKFRRTFPQLWLKKVALTVCTKPTSPLNLTPEFSILTPVNIFPNGRQK